MLRERGVTLESIARLVQDLQRPYNPQLSLEECLVHVEKVIKKREVQNAVLTGLTLDIYAEKGLLPEPLQSILIRDDPLYGVDEVLALSITNIYGSIGFTTFGYLDKVKTGILENINVKREGTVNTFLDDLVAAIAAAAAARLAHH
ncbi:MAG: phosphatidylglycerophosphatase A [Firmicutes bacterium]|nr:phosphatidylglycerophosphatase A [Bacillota bacterium]HOB34882.1 phosphatidylglycerophosphatase A [Bacillota bacterium]HPZ90374.1 phosphatidylglycerophosphatase A [Bacillota bacterium]HQE02472.1 phosphatidylglycerophosphatase A [Bacillota bacterium]